MTMANKRALHHFHRRIQPLNSWVLLAACLLCVVVSVLALRQNNLTSVRLRNDLLAVDEQNGDVEAALRKLRQHIYAHMNASLDSGNNIYPPIQLKYRYERLVLAEKDRVAAANQQIYSQAQATCERLQPQGFFGATRLDCVQEQIAKAGALQEQPVPDALYKFNFASPRWSPDLAGWSLVAAVFLGLLLLGRFSIERWLRHQLD
jgi:hypothetical protein